MISFWPETELIFIFNLSSLKNREEGKGSNFYSGLTKNGALVERYDGAEKV